LLPLVASRPVEAPWLRPPLRSLTWVEAFLDGPLSEGFSDQAAVAAYRAFTSFLLGHMLLEVAALGADRADPVGGLDAWRRPGLIGHVPGTGRDLDQGGRTCTHSSWPTP
jgi:hypothetical protein